MRLLSLQERHQQADTFVALWVKEFMTELAHAESVSRGNASARKDQSLALLFNVSCALVSLVPIPGVALAWMAMPSLLKVVDSLGKTMKAVLKEAVGFVAKEGIDAFQEEIQSALTVSSAKLSSTALIDHELMEVLVRWLGVELVKRYEQLLMERLSTHPSEGLESLARVAARRCVGFLATNPLPSGGFDVQMAHLLSGVALGQELPWYQRPLQGLNQKKIKGRDEAACLGLSAEDALKKGAWYSDNLVYREAETEWLASSLLKTLPDEWLDLPKYGYIAGKLALHTAVHSNPPDFMAWQSRRLYQPITVPVLQAYLASPRVLDAKTNKTTATETLAEFAGFPKRTVVVLSADLRALCLAHGNFEGVDWRGSQFSGDLSDASFQHAILYGCTFDHVTATLKSRVSFSGSRLSFSVFRQASLSGEVDLSQADLTGVDLTDARLGRVIHLGTRWYKAKLDGLDDEGLLQEQAQQVAEIARTQAQHAEALLQLHQHVNEHTQVIDELRQQIEQLLRQPPTDDNLLPQALAQLLHIHEQALAEKLADLHYYIPSNVVEHAPESQPLADYVQKGEKGEITWSPEGLSSAMDQYSNGPESLFLLLGDPGAGKSLWAWQHSHTQLRAYQDLLAQSSQTTAWIPLVIELKDYTLSDVKDLLPRYLKDVCRLSLQAIHALQTSHDPKHRLLVIFDGFDELKQEADGSTTKKDFKDFFNTCGAGAWATGQIKIMVTCRVRHLEHSLVEKQYFGRGAHHHFYRRVLLPFTLTQVYDYLKERTHTLPLATYQSAIEQSESLNGMVRNPFILRLFAEALPDLHENGIKEVKRYDIYDIFVRQWLLREIGRFSDLQKEMLEIQEPGDEIRVIEQFLFYAGMLAIQMYQHDALVISFNKNDPAFGVWRRFDDIVTMQALDEESIKKRLAMAYDCLTAVERSRLKRLQDIPDQAAYVEKKLPEELEKAENK